MIKKGIGVKWLLSGAGGGGGQVLPQPSLHPCICQQNEIYFSDLLPDFSLIIYPNNVVSRPCRLKFMQRAGFQLTFYFLQCQLEDAKRWRHREFSIYSILSTNTYCRVYLYLLLEGAPLPARVLLPTVRGTAADVARLPRVHVLHVHKLIRVLDDGNGRRAVHAQAGARVSRWLQRRRRMAVAAAAAAVGDACRRLGSQKGKLVTASEVAGRRQVGRRSGFLVGRQVGLRLEVCGPRGGAGRRLVLVRHGQDRDLVRMGLARAVGRIKLERLEGEVFEMFGVEGGAGRWRPMLKKGSRLLVVKGDRLWMLKGGWWLVGSWRVTVGGRLRVGRGRLRVGGGRLRVVPLVARFLINIHVVVRPEHKMKSKRRPLLQRGTVSFSGNLVRLGRKCNCTIFEKMQNSRNLAKLYKRKFY